MYVCSTDTTFCKVHKSISYEKNLFGIKVFLRVDMQVMIFEIFTEIFQKCSEFSTFDLLLDLTCN